MEGTINQIPKLRISACRTAFELGGARKKIEKEVEVGGDGNLLTVPSPHLRSRKRSMSESNIILRAGSPFVATPKDMYGRRYSRSGRSPSVFV